MNAGGAGAPGAAGAGKEDYGDKGTSCLLVM